MFFACVPVSVFFFVLTNFAAANLQRCTGTLQQQISATITQIVAMAVSNTSATLSASCESYMFGSFSCGPGVQNLAEKKTPT